MAPRTTSAVILATALLGCSGVASATTGVSGSGSPAGVQYQPEQTGQVPVVPPTDTPPPPDAPAPAAEAPIATPAAAPSVSPPATVKTPTRHPHAVPSKVPAATQTPVSGEPAPAAEGPVAVPIASVTAAEQPATLPFTGFDVVPVAIGGLALLCLGLVVRRRTRDGRS
ncbi:MAG: hypothetical protein JWP17_3387 [Solirubrobacterales bacterium]|jgi:Tfp pilus assembly protein FimV|nr:hypothetical protein [Solirubrobacterales bacterium]